MSSTRIHWIRAEIGGVVAEVAVFAIVFPTLHLFGQRAFLASILIASALVPLLATLWVCRRVHSQFVLHGALVGIVAALFISPSLGDSPSHCCIRSRTASKSSVASPEA